MAEETIVTSIKEGENAPENNKVTADASLEKAKGKKTRRTYIGGQALIEGVMMRGKGVYASAVRDEEGNIQVEARRLPEKPDKKRLRDYPFIRGMFAMISSLVLGMKSLTRSAQVLGEEEPSDFEKMVAEKFKIDILSIVSMVSVFLGIVLAFGLFMFLPQFLTNLIVRYAGLSASSLGYYAIVGGFKLVIFILYIVVVAFIPSIKRTYMYHAAEHKTISCYEHSLPLTVENVKHCSRIHDRCGTTFLFLTVAVNILIFSLVSWAIGFYKIENFAFRLFANLGLEIVLLPVITGVSYELLKALSLSDNPILLIFKAPGMLLQCLTTKKPTDDMLEVAIQAFNTVLEMENDKTLPETYFAVPGKISEILSQVKGVFASQNIDEADAEWIVSIVCDIPRSELSKEGLINLDQAKQINRITKERLTGRPLWYIIGDTEFYGYTIKVDERVLIPRPETELLVEHAIKSIEQGDKVLELCTGSGCVAIAIAKEKEMQVTAVDISQDALDVAAENARLNKANVQFLQSNLFENVKGKYNLIVANPPYIKTGDIPTLQREVKDNEPHIALDGGDDGLEFYRRINERVRYHIIKGGMLILEIGADQANDVLKIFSRCDYAMVVKDLEGHDRLVKIVF